MKYFVNETERNASGGIATGKDYNDIIDLPHHVSSTRPRMSMQERAAQFSPFDALTGYDAAIKETARLTDQKIELDDCEKEKINNTIRRIAAHPADGPEVEITYFRPDSKKSGGAYATVSGAAKGIDEYERIIVMQDGVKIPIDEIIEIHTGCQRKLKKV